MRACLVGSLLLLLSSACATIARGPTREINILGPQGLSAYNGSEQVALQPAGKDGDQIKYVGTLDKNTKSLTLKMPGRTLEAQLDTKPGVGWIIADSILIVPLFVDMATRAWYGFKDVDVADITGNPPEPEASKPPPEMVGPQRPPPRTVAESTPQPTPQAMPGRRALLDKGKLAVLDFQNFAKDLSKEDVHYFADVVRGATLRAAPRMDVMTRENLLVLLQASGKDASQCEGECEVDTGRRIGADAVISGEVLKVGSRYKISLKLHETHDGRLLSTGVASGKSIDELDEKLQAAAAELLAPR